jgi:DNA-binding Xre family transcriptional regulator
MNIKHEIQSFLDRTGWTLSKFAREAKIPVPVLHRLKTGEREGMTLRTYEKLRPFLYGDHPQQRASGE